MRDWMMTIGFIFVAGLVALQPSLADTGFMRVETRDGFLALVQDKPLKRFGIRLDVHPDGRIDGRAMGRDVTGSWNWEGGFFCRTLEYGAQVLERNCQTVALRGDTLRFTADRGAGDFADLRMR